MKIKYGFVGFFFLFFLQAHARVTGGPGSIKKEKKELMGGVFEGETKKPLCSVNVTAFSARAMERKVFTDEKGYYSFSDLKPGLYKLIFEKQGFR